MTLTTNTQTDTKSNETADMFMNSRDQIVCDQKSD